MQDENGAEAAASAKDPLRVRRMLLAAIAAASAAVLDLAEIARDDGEIEPAELCSRETTENLADALQMVLAIELEGLVEQGAGSAGDSDDDAERREGVGQLLGAVGRFLEGWA